LRRRELPPRNFFQISIRRGQQLAGVLAIVKLLLLTQSRFDFGCAFFCAAIPNHDFAGLGWCRRLPMFWLAFPL